MPTNFNVFKQPKSYAIFITIPAKNSSSGKVAHIRIGAAKTIGECEDLIMHDIRIRKETFSGLVSPEKQKGNLYRVFRAEWTEIKDLNHTV